MTRSAFLEVRASLGCPDVTNRKTVVCHGRIDTTTIEPGLACACVEQLDVALVEDRTKQVVLRVRSRYRRKTTTADTRLVDERRSASQISARTNQRFGDQKIVFGGKNERNGSEKRRIDFIRVIDVTRVRPLAEEVNAASNGKRNALQEPEIPAILANIAASVWRPLRETQISRLRAGRRC